ncbi:HIT family protein [Halalkalibacter kiskunsagensis]|uniref:HIT family protein n=1 Tax=Halalkalibacter kiskunsagensis TaxID=1548599 RepID=A0ABV6KCL5_9BACI
MSQCPICEKHETVNEDVLFENQNWVITHGPLASQLFGYIYIEPKRHVENWTEFTDSELAEIGPLIKKVESALKEVISIDRLYSVTISEAVRHIHFHLITRETTSEVKGLPLIEQATQQKVVTEQRISEAELLHVKTKLKSVLS